ncbi:hypothetical protein [Mycobacterium sp. NPDC006124]|uniref:hypothetical protein n=1 Tax=Mycobacterium sp. NPDC006124 TaxID=3156729 RepID=UPI0033BC14FB
MSVAATSSVVEFSDRVGWEMAKSSPKNSWWRFSALAIRQFDGNHTGAGQLEFPQRRRRRLGGLVIDTRTDALDLDLVRMVAMSAESERSSCGARNSAGIVQLLAHLAYPSGLLTPTRRAVQRLHLRLLVNALHDRLLGRIVV